MKTIISPAKKMRQLDDGLPPLGVPVFEHEAEQILEWLSTLSYEQARELWECSDRIAQPSFDRLEATINDGLDARTTPAVMSYDGIAFTYMAPSVFEYGELDFIQEHLRIISGFYGVLKPMDGVVPYRLEMQAKAYVGHTSNLYEFWGDKIYREVIDDDHLIVNLASKEYSKAVEDHLQSGDRMVTCVFAEQLGGKLVQKGVYCKMARGEMVRYMAANSIEDPEGLKDFEGLGYKYADEYSSTDELVFLRESERS